MNSRIVIAEPQIGNDFFPAMPAKRTARQLWNDGYQAFCKRQPMGDLVTDAERAGYMAACRDCAYADTSAYLVKRGDVQ